MVFEAGGRAASMMGRRAVFGAEAGGRAAFMMMKEAVFADCWWWYLRPGRGRFSVCRIFFLFLMRF